jgi:hypothetical protein
MIWWASRGGVGSLRCGTPHAKSAIKVQVQNAGQRSLTR